VNTRPLDEPAIREELGRVLASSAFAQNERLGRFLRFVVERHLESRSGECKESVIGVEVFGRRPDYDPNQDSIVRTEAGRLRSRLVEYYAGDGRDDPLIIEIPKGGYSPAFRRPDVVRQPEPRVGWRLRPMFVAGACSLAVVTAGFWVVHAHRDPIRIAVLPLENLTREAGNEYFSDGLTDEIIHDLSLIEGLQVRSRTSSYAFKGKPRNARETGQELGVDYLLEGSVLRAGSRLRIDAQLIRASDDLPLWSEQFDRELTDVFAIQDEISIGIVNSLRLRLGQGRRRYETSIEAYDLYLRARVLATRARWLGRPPGALSAESIANFEQAIEKDRSFAPAYAGLAAMYANRSVQFPEEHPADELGKMRAAADRAIQLDPLLAEAYAAQGLVKARDMKWADAEQSFRRTIEIDPNRAGSHVDYGFWLLAVQGRLVEAVAQLREAEAVDPRAPLVHQSLALLLISAGQYDEAATHCGKWQDEAAADQCLSLVRLAQGRTPEALELMNRDPGFTRNPQSRGFLGFAYARSGRRDEAERMAAATKFPNEQALIYAGLGDKDRTFEALRRMTALGAQRVGLYLNYPELALLHDDSRLNEFRKSLGLPN
jgi:TolB-like protein/tetratricopeptide (TPR) repeat protein